tara:strand:- start:1314 stop:1595 length:282 start_codon:yes stop_codon:yes gene_type:complete
MTKTVNFMGEELTPIIGEYANGQTSIQLVDRDGMPFMTASVAHDVNIPDDCVIIKNYSENEGIMQALIKAGIIEKPFCEIPVNFVKLYVAALK